MVESLIDRLQKDDYKTMAVRRVLLLLFERLLSDGDYDHFRETILWIVHSGLFRDVVKDEEMISLASEVRLSREMFNESSN
ncbi:hypothetical protein [Alkalibacillus haloalkaliphilus]|uniref:Uncharacterized protein n=1 Tax=Alkalibacillus haloalkaliphilus TaxID=94136 RepID=A0A511W6M3_9BACI|nr:hypothetical protein [Alkalibacillus haloalkaliphilus]GEN46647.1 hypothetical protein AHA02nite_24230 [Alkalibacillus haloalkaliphilus]